MKFTPICGLHYYMIERKLHPHEFYYVLLGQKLILIKLITVDRSYILVDG